MVTTKEVLSLKPSPVGQLVLILEMAIIISVSNQHMEG